MKGWREPLIVIAVLMASTCSPAPQTVTLDSKETPASRRPTWQLRFRLGASPTQVEQILGPPYKIDDHPPIVDFFPDVPGQVLRYHFSSGLVARYVDDRLFAVTFFTYSDREAWMPFAEPIVEDVRLTDSRDAVLAKLGQPTRIEEDSLDAGVDRDDPVVDPALTRLYWRRPQYNVALEFRRQAQWVATEKKKQPPLPPDSIAFAHVYR